MWVEIPQILKLTTELREAACERTELDELRTETAVLREKLVEEQRQCADKISQVEKELDDERRSLVSDLSRSKRDVLKLMQVVTHSQVESSECKHQFMSQFSQLICVWAKFMF